MSRDWTLYVDDIRLACRKILRFTADLDRAAFFADDRTYDAVLHNLQIIGEAAKHIPHSARVRASDIAWRRIAGLRDVIAHAYFGVDEEIIWDLVRNKVPELLGAIDTLDQTDG